jgi:DNA-binding response OmpR family regulator
MPGRLLIVDDEKDILDMLRACFTLEGYEVITASGGAEALKLAERSPDLILLDINMPDMDGLSVCERIRAFVSCPILFLTARVEDGDKVRGFAAGGDDYIVKPFSLEELEARVKAHLRREERRQGSAHVRFRDLLAIDYEAREAYYDGKPIPLAKKEFEIVELLSKHPGQVFDRERIYERLWGWDSEGDSAVISEHIRRVRQKFTTAGSASPIDTIWGVGYRWSK